MRLRSSQRLAPTSTPHRNSRTTSTNTLNDKHNEEKGERILRKADTEEKEPSTPPRRTTRRPARSTATERRRITRQPAEKEDVVTAPRTAKATRTTRRIVRPHRERSKSEDEGDSAGGSARHPITIIELVSKDKVAMRADSDDSSSLSSFQSPTEFKSFSDFGSERMFLRSSPTPQQMVIIPRSLPVVSRMVRMPLDMVPDGETEDTTERTKERQSTFLQPSTEGKHSRDTNDVEMERTMNEQPPTMGSRQSTMDEQSSTANNNESTKRRSIGPTLTQEELAVLGEDTNMDDAPQGNGEVATKRETAAQQVQPLRTEAEEDEVRNELLGKGDQEAVFLEENDISDLSSIPSPPELALSPKSPLIDAAKITEAKTYTRISVASYLSSSPVPSTPPQGGMSEAEPPTADVEEYQPWNITQDIATMAPERHGELPDNLPVPTATEDGSESRKDEMMDIDSSSRSTDRSSSLGPSAALFQTSHQLQHTVVHSNPLKQQVTAATSPQSPELISDGEMDVNKPREAERSSSLGPSAALFTFSYPVQPNHHAAVPSSPVKQQITDATSSQSPQLFTFAQPAPTLEETLTEAESKVFQSERADSFDSIPSDCTFTSSYKAELAEKAAGLAASKQSHDDYESESGGFKERVSDNGSDMEAEALPERRSEKGVREPSSSSSKRTASDAFSSGRDTEIVMMWRDRVSAEENAARLVRKAVLGDDEDNDSDEDNEPSELGDAGLPNDPIEPIPSTKSQPLGNRVAREEGREIEPEAVPSKDDLDDFCRTSDIDPAETHQERGFFFRVASSMDDSSLDEEEDVDGDADVEMAEAQELVVPMSSPTKGRRDVYDDISGANGSESESESESGEEGKYEEEEEDDKRGGFGEVPGVFQVPMRSIEVDESKDAIDTSGETIRTSAAELQTATVEIKKEPSLPRPISAASAPAQPPQQDGNSAAALIIQLRSLLVKIQGPDFTLSKPEVMDIEGELNRIELTRDGKRLRVKAAANRLWKGNE